MRYKNIKFSLWSLSVVIWFFCQILISLYMLQISYFNLLASLWNWKDVAFYCRDNCNKLLLFIESRCWNHFMENKYHLLLTMNTSGKVTWVWLRICLLLHYSFYLLLQAPFAVDSDFGKLGCVISQKIGM